MPTPDVREEESILTVSAIGQRASDAVEQVSTEQKMEEIFQNMAVENRNMQLAIDRLHKISDVRDRIREHLRRLFTERLQVPDADREAIRARMEQEEQEYQEGLRESFRSWLEFYRSAIDRVQRIANERHVITPHMLLTEELLRPLEEMTRELFPQSAEHVLAALKDEVANPNLLTEDRRMIASRVVGKVQDRVTQEELVLIDLAIDALLRLRHGKSGHDYVDHWSPDSVYGLFGKVPEEADMDRLRSGEYKALLKMDDMKGASVELVVNGKKVSVYLPKDDVGAQQVMGDLIRRLEDEGKNRLTFLHYRKDDDVRRMLASMSDGEKLILTLRENPEKRIVVEGIDASDDFRILEGEDLITKDQLIREPMKYLDHRFDVFPVAENGSQPAVPQNGHAVPVAQGVATGAG